MSTSVRLQPDSQRRLDELAVQTGRSKAFYIREAIERVLPDLEYEYSILRDVELFRAGRLETRSWAEVKADLDLDD